MPSRLLARPIGTLTTALRARPVIAASAIVVAAALLVLLAAGILGPAAARETAALARALESGSSFRALPAGDLVLESLDPEAMRAARILLVASPKLAEHVEVWMAGSDATVGIEPGQVSRRSVVVRFGTDGTPESAAVLEGRFAPARVREAFGASGPVVEHYGGQEILTAPGLGAVAIVDDRRILVATSYAMARASVDAAAGRDPSAASMDACAAIDKLPGVVRLAGRIPAGARLTALLPAYLSAAPFEAATVVATLESADGLRLRFDMTHASPARAEMAAERLRSDFVLDVLAIGGGRATLDALAPFALVACDAARVVVRLDVPRESLGAGRVESSGPPATGSLPPELLAPLPEVAVDPSRYQSPEAAEGLLAPSPGVSGSAPPVARAPAPESRATGERRPFIWSPGEEGATSRVRAVPRVGQLVSTLEAIVDAERRYRDANGSYATLDELRRFGLLDPGTADPATLAGYRLRLVAFDDRHFEFVAEPVEADADAPVLRVREDGVVRIDPSPERPAGPAPSTPE